MYSTYCSKIDHLCYNLYNYQVDLHMFCKKNRMADIYYLPLHKYQEHMTEHTTTPVATSSNCLHPGYKLSTLPMMYKYDKGLHKENIYFPSLHQAMKRTNLDIDQSNYSRTNLERQLNHILSTNFLSSDITNTKHHTARKLCSSVISTTDHNLFNND